MQKHSVGSVRALCDNAVHGCLLGNSNLLCPQLLDTSRYNIVVNSLGDMMTKINTTKSRCCCLNVTQNMFNMNVCGIQNKGVTSLASSRVMMG